MAANNEQVLEIEGRMNTDHDRVTIYHNPHCSKSRRVLAMLRERGIEPEVVEYLRHPPDAAELARILTLLDMQPRELMRTKEQAYTDAGLERQNLDSATLIRAMIEHPILIERPIVLANGQAALGRPPEQILEIL